MMNGLTKLLFFNQLNGMVPLEVNDSFIHRESAEMFILDEKITNFVKKRERLSHKGNYGHAIIFAGSYGKMGAAVLASKACLRSGAGLLTANVPKCGYEIIQIAVPESMCLTDENYLLLTTLPDISMFDAVGIGPGIGQDELTVQLLEQVLLNAKEGLVIDADGLNIISSHPHLLEILPPNAILTPHIKEFDRLVGTTQDKMERFKKQKAFCMRYNCVVILKDACTSICNSNGTLYFNTSGNPGMATGGSGDVLTGIVTGLLAQGYDSLLAALIGVYFHGVAGDLAAGDKGYNALIASDIVDRLKVEIDFR